MSRVILWLASAGATLGDAFVVIMVSTCLAQVTKKTENAWYYFFFMLICFGWAFNIYKLF